MTLQKRFDPGWLLVVLLTVFAIAPLTYPGFFEAHSGFLPVFNVTHLSDAPNWGRVAEPVRGEGKLPYLLVQPFVGQMQTVSSPSYSPYSGVVAIKWGYALAFLLGALGMYAWARHWLGVRGGVLAATVYTYLPWHLGTVYVRGAYAEAWLWAFWPFVLWSLDRLRERRFLAAAVVGLPALAAALWTQIGLTLFLAFGLFMAILLRTRKLSTRGWAALLLIVAGVVVAALTLPLPEARIPFDEHFLQPYQLLSAAWGEGLSFQLGLAAVGLTLVAVAIGASRKPSPPLGPALRFWLVVLVVLVLLTLPLSALFWQVAGLDELLTYPWQVLALSGLPLAFLAGSVVRLDERLATLPAWAGLVALVILASYPYLAPRFTQVDPGPEPVALLQPVEADAPQILLLDYGITAPTEITPTLTLTLTWQAVEPVANDYTIFVHVLTADDTKVAQRDTRPCEGECPTHTWQPGEIIVDRYELGLGPDAPPGPYHLAVGLYLLDSGERAIVAGQGPALSGRDDRTVHLDVK